MPTIFVNAMIWYLCKCGSIIKAVLRPEPKPPDPKLRRERLKRRRLRDYLRLVTSMGVVIFGGNNDVAYMAAADGNISEAHAVQIRSAIANTHDTTLLENIGALSGVADSGASKISTPFKEDFVEGTLNLTKGVRSMNGISGGLNILGEGTVRYEVLDSHGVTQIWERPGLLIEDLPCRLIPPQQVMEDDSHGDYRINGEHAYFIFANNNGRLDTPFHPATNLPMITMFKSIEDASSKLENSLYACVTDESNQNLTPSQKEALRWHWKLGHVSMQVVNWLGNQGLLGRLSQRLSKLSDCPKCGTCQYGKQTRKPTGTTHTKVRPDKDGGIIKDKLEPGDEIAVDQFNTLTYGRKYNTYGKEKDTERFKYGTIFVDIASGFTRVYFHVSPNAHETIKSKLLFEREALNNGITIKRYRTDNGIFSTQEFMQEIKNKDQFITFSGVGAHHQNGVAERNIRTVVTKARTMLLHAMLRWPDQTENDLWPMAMQHAADLINIIPKMGDGLSPEEKFSRSLKQSSRLENLPVWGCPAYVLEPTLQDGKKLPKWQSRSRRGQFMGWSPLHASNVALVRNLDTGAISPQFHVVFDNWFETVMLRSPTARSTKYLILS